MTRPYRLLMGAMMCAFAVAVDANAQQLDAPGPVLHPMEVPRDVKAAVGQVLLREALESINVTAARTQFNVAGRGLTVAVLDTGLNVAHADFRSAIKAQRNFSSDDQGVDSIVTDRIGHGTHVTGIIIADGPRRIDPTSPPSVNVQINPAGLHEGVATEASVVALKVMPALSWKAVEDALQWVLDNYKTFGLSVVNMSIQGKENLQHDNESRFDRMKSLVAELSKHHIPVVVSSGNSFAFFDSAQGMSYPAIVRDAISVAAVYDADVTDKTKLPMRHPDWDNTEGVAVRVRQGQITPFSQRLAGTDWQTDLMAPGAEIASTGDGEFGETSMAGTSQAAPIVSGIILLMQEWYREFFIRLDAANDEKKAAELRAKAIESERYRPSVAQLVAWLRDGIEVTDNYGDDDNVTNTNAKFMRVDAVRALTAMRKELTKE
ncbi:MAG: hypothetical protein A3G81_29105 [Betaproteobacteria bacterium RIFCSPLOWO2_12_FULL_65_14]|nr:MAG: hypothetical protein A3G81_29105 [Betaproteobacteria bacterium RIFCSPLOWO2_12_FULL_65_14]